MIYKTKDVCCQEIQIDVKDGIIKKINFVKGCNGNLKGITSLAVGRDADEVIEALSGITCNHRNTSCPDQLAKALSEFKNT